MTAIDYLSVLSKHKPNQRFQGLSRVGTDYPCSGGPLGGSKTRMESSASNDTPCQISGPFLFLLPLLEPPFHLFFFLSFCSDVATTSSSTSTTASSLASATTSSFCYCFFFGLCLVFDLDELRNYLI